MNPLFLGSRAGPPVESIQDQQFAKPNLLFLNVYCNRGGRCKGHKASEDEEFEEAFAGRNAKIISKPKPNAICPTRYTPSLYSRVILPAPEENSFCHSSQMPAIRY